MNVERELKIGKTLYICKFCGSEVKLTSHGAICTGCGVVNPPKTSVSKEDIKVAVVAIVRKYDNIGLVQIHNIVNYLLGTHVPEDLMNEVFVELGLL